jgi:DNA-binding protein YbaB
MELFDLDGLPEPVRDLGRRIQELALSLGAARARGEADDGRITAITDMSGTLLQVDISPRAIRELDNLTLADRVVEAIAAARQSARATYRDGLSSIQLLGTTLADLPGTGAAPAGPDPGPAGG